MAEQTGSPSARPSDPEGTAEGAWLSRGFSTTPPAGQLARALVGRGPSLSARRSDYQAGPLPAGTDGRDRRWQAGLPEGNAWLVVPCTRRGGSLRQSWGCRCGGGRADVACGLSLSRAFGTRTLRQMLDLSFSLLGFPSGTKDDVQMDVSWTVPAAFRWHEDQNGLRCLDEEPSGKPASEGWWSRTAEGPGDHRPPCRGIGSRRP